MKKIGRIFMAMVTVLALATITSAATIHVPGDSATIQAGINGAVEGDTVLVAAATYTGEGNWKLDYGGKNIVVKSAEGPEYTTIDMFNAGLTPAVIFQNEEDSTAIFQGFTLVNSGYHLIICGSSSPTIKGNIFRDNDLCCMITPMWRTMGSVILCKLTTDFISRPHIDSNFIYVQGGYGITLEYVAGARICGNWIEGYDGVGIHANGSAAHIENNIIKGFISFNECNCGEDSWWNGGGIYVGGSMLPWVTEDPVIVNNTITDVGYGIMISNGPRPITVANNIVAARCKLLHVDPSGTPPDHIIANNDFFDLGGGCLFEDEYWGDTASYFIGIDGNISADPLFCDTANGDLHLSSASYCAPDNNGGILIGALGTGCDGGYICGDATGDYTINVGDPVYLICHIFKAGPPPFAIGAGDANCDGDTNVGDAIYLINYIFKNGPEPCCP